MTSNPLSGARYLLRGLRLIRQPGVKRYVLIPLLINFSIFAGLFWLLAGQVGGFVSWMMPSLPDWLWWLSWLVWLIFALTALLVIYAGFSALANLIGAPFNGYLSAAVERRLTGSAPENPRSLIEEAFIAIIGEVKKLLLFGSIALLLVLISFIPVLNLAAPLLWLLFSAWMMSLQYADYPFGNHGLGFSQMRRELARKRLLSLGFGGAVMLGTLLPLFNFIIMPVAVAGATAMRVEQFHLDNDSTS